MRKQSKIIEDTLDYYNKKAKEFVAETVDVPFAETQEIFLDYLPDGRAILDFGCGSGRDTKYFLGRGYTVEAIDGSEELCKIASEYTGISVKQMMFQELACVEKYDGIWACASILHLEKGDLPDVLQKMANALKTGGVIYTSFKYGDFEGERNGRYFTYLTEESFERIVGDISELIIEKCWITSDVRVERGEERWLNLILRKQAIH